MITDQIYTILIFFGSANYRRSKPEAFFEEMKKK